MTAFGDDLYARLRQGCQDSAAVIVPALLRAYGPATVVDVGCGEGWFAQAFHDAGVSVVGIDAERPPGCPLPRDRFVEADLAAPSAAEAIPGADLAVCLEVAEHLPARCGPALVASLCRASPVVAFSAAAPGQGGNGHVNERWQSYWAGLFASHGYRPDVALRDAIWDDARVEPWYRQNIVVYSERPSALFSAAPLDVIHPEIYRWRLEAARELDAILRWIEAGFPPWGCDNCRGAEYGPDGVPCPACGGHSESCEPPARAQAILTYLQEALR